MFGAVKRRLCPILVSSLLLFCTYQLELHNKHTHTRSQHLHLQNNNCSHLSATSYCYFPHHIIQWSCKVVQIKHISPYLTLSFCSVWLFRLHSFLQTVAMHSFWSIRCEPFFSSPYFSFSVFNLILIICLLCLCYCECENFLFNQKFAQSVELCLCLGTKNTMAPIE